MRGWRATALSGLVLLGGYGCDNRNSYVPPPPPRVQACHPQLRQVSDYLEFTGNTQAFNSVQLVARVQGYLEKVLFHDGDQVRKGETLFLIQQNTYQARLKQAEAQIIQQQANLDHTETELRRYTNLVQQHAASQLDLDNWRFQRDSAKAALTSAEASRDLAKLDLEYTRVVAPFDGRIDRRLKDPGNLVGAGEFTPLAQINQIDPIYVYFTINETDLLNMMQQSHLSPSEEETLKLPVHLALSDEKAYPHPGTLDFTAISVTPATGSMTLRAVFSNPTLEILPGLFARVRLQLPDSATKALVVPETAVAYDQLGSYLLTVDAQNTVQRHSVKLGRRTEQDRVIKTGIGIEDWVIVRGMQHAIPGNTVTPERLPPCEAAPGEERQ